MKAFLGHLFWADQQYLEKHALYLFIFLLGSHLTMGDMKVFLSSTFAFQICEIQIAWSCDVILTISPYSLLGHSSAVEYCAILITPLRRLQWKPSGCGGTKRGETQCSSAWRHHQEWSAPDLQQESGKKLGRCPGMGTRTAWACQGNAAGIDHLLVPEDHCEYMKCYLFQEKQKWKPAHPFIRQVKSTAHLRKTMYQKMYVEKILGLITIYQLHSSVIKTWLLKSTMI